VDNLPPRLLPEFSEEILKHPEYQRFHGIAVGIDARTVGIEHEHETAALQQLLALPDRLIVFIDAQPHVLLKRFSETRRRHPLAGPSNSLPEAISKERKHLEFIAAQADLLIDTTDLTPRGLRDMITNRIVEHRDGLSILLESFAFKRGVPTDADFVFDARALPNPYWREDLRGLTGMDEPVKLFLDSDEGCVTFYTKLSAFIIDALRDFDASDRSYVTVAIGCTGGQHRSVYLTEKLSGDILSQFPAAKIRHRDLSEAADS
jgi:UPF0042 nucleotide-binding protein